MMKFGQDMDVVLASSVEKNPKSEKCPFSPSNVGFSHFCGTDFRRTLFVRKMVLGL